MYKAELLICCPQTYLSPSVLHLKLKKKKKGFNFDLLLSLLSSIHASGNPFSLTFTIIPNLTTSTIIINSGYHSLSPAATEWCPHLPVAFL